MGLLGVRSFKEQKILDKNNKLIKKYIDQSATLDFIKSLGMNSRADREITLEEIEQYLNANPKAAKKDNQLLFYDIFEDEEIIEDINQNMKNLAGHEKGTSWMKWGAMFSGNSADQISAAGFKAIIEQNKILIRQNELLRRQNERILNLLEQK